MLYPILKMLGSDYSIGVVTYVKRFEEYFKPLLLSLEKYFPDVEKNVVLNGYYDQVLQQEYLKRAKEFLNTTSVKNVVAYQENQGLSKCWNQLVLHSRQSKVLILNDDVKIGRLFRWTLEPQILFFDTMVINRSWSHFVISKETVRRVGWFDERFLGVGMEDADYTLRMAIARGELSVPNMHKRNIYCLGMRNIVAKNEDPGWKLLSGSVNKKYAAINTDFFKSKWEVSKDFLPGSVRGFGGECYRIHPGMETPMFYDYSLLDNPLESALK